MKKSFYFSVTLLLLSFSMMAQSKSNSLLVHFPLNGNAQDISGNQNNGTIIGNVIAAEGPGGEANTAMYFDGESYIEVAANSSLNSPDESLTISYWVKTEAFYSGWSSVVCKSDLGEAHYRLGLGLNNAFFAFRGGLAWNLNYPFTIDEGWVFVAATYSDNKARFYKNGTFQAEYNLTPLNIFDEDAPLYIGYDPALGEDYLIGWVSDVRIYSDQLSDDDITVIYEDLTPSSLFESQTAYKSIDVYPNPAKDQVKIKGLEIFKESADLAVDVYNTSGQRVMSEVLKTGNNSINMSNLPSGIYNLLITDGVMLASSKVFRE
ncbi:MAG: T9SS type A sorting domain-containing protein [Bacteroidetes bacterium]|jgi:hypothetical protein|nr:T9SS type A sorting domain-containing protein [Bacteroidota bacterium]